MPLLESFVEDQWVRLPAWRREGGDYANARERVMATLVSDDWSVKAHNALIDDDYFVFAIAADVGNPVPERCALNFAASRNTSLASACRVTDQKFMPKGLFVKWTGSSFLNWAQTHCCPHWCN